MTDNIRTPVCPLCKVAPRFRMDVQCFCGSEGCPVICWDATEDYGHDGFLAVAQGIDLSAAGPEASNNEGNRS